VVGTNPLRHSNHEWEVGGAWQETPPTHVMSKGEGAHVQGACDREWEGGGWQRRPPSRDLREGGAGGGCESPPSSGRIVVGRDGLQLAFRAREMVVVVDATCVSSERGAGDGHKSPPSLKLRVGGW
jgi:hypothetical protein